MEVARSLPGASGKVGLLGYCLGGLMTFITTARKGADASVVYYGGGMDQYIGESSGIRSPLLVHQAEEDEYIPRDAQRAIIESLKNSGASRVFSYPRCSHAFARHRGTHYDKDAATLANERTANFFELQLKH